MRRSAPQRPGGQVDKVVGLIMFWLSFATVALLAGADLVGASLSYCDRLLGGGN
ncbi:hypothetical protein [Kaistia sp. MMO-174]|uniref:hypothetical protein n=1 Tax=Kaistia sp. MMO-174 TaxID=3081256 RepID=UPI0030184908